MRDRERTIDKPAGVASRVTIVGDSFVENHATRLSLPIAIEQKLSAKASPIEVVSLGVSATGIASYYYRLKDVGLAMASDAVVVLFYAGNDFVAANESFDSWNFPPLIDESPGRAILGRIKPRTNWLLTRALARVAVPAPSAHGALHHTQQRGLRGRGRLAACARVQRKQRGQARL